MGLLSSRHKQLNGQILTEYVHLLIEMKEYDEAKKELQLLLSRKPENTLSLMYEFGILCYKMADYENAEKALQSVISHNSKDLMDGAYAHLIAIYRRNKIKQNNKECEKWLNSWIECNAYAKNAYFCYFDYLHDTKQWQKLKTLYSEWTNAMQNEYNEEFEGTQE